jgi:two-component system chemotaxis response regulator CheY
MGPRILIADDDPLIRTLIAACLQDIAEVHKAGDGARALQMLAHTNFDLLLLDWDMPDPDGLAVLATLRNRGIRTPVVMVTAQAERARVVEALRAGASDYLVKPFESAALRAKVQRFCKPRPPQPVHVE